MDKLLVIIILMAVVTYIPRMFPLIALSNAKLPPRINTFFQFIPYAVLGALIFPGILSSTGSAQSSLAGAAVAVVLAFFRINVMLVVLGGILGVYAFDCIN